MKPIFIEYITEDKENVSININNIVYVKEIDNSTCDIICIGGIIISVNESFEEVSADIGRIIDLESGAS